MSLLTLAGKMVKFKNGNVFEALNYRLIQNVTHICKIFGTYLGPD